MVVLPNAEGRASPDLDERLLTEPRDDEVLDAEVLIS